MGAAGLDASQFGLLMLAVVLVNNVVLTQYLGLCPFLGGSRRMDAALGLGLATALVLTLACAVAFVLDRYLLTPLDARFLRTIVFIAAIAVAVQAVETVLRACLPVLHRVLGIYLPLITTNCAVLGVALLSVEQASALSDAVARGSGSALGFALVMVVFAGLRERLQESAVPAALRGTPIALIGAAILSMAFMGFSGLGASR